MSQTNTENGRTYTYDDLQTIAQTIQKQVCETVLDPVIRKQFKEDRGHKLRATLPDKSTEYVFEEHGFEALVLPSERRITNYVYNGVPLTENGLLRDRAALEDMVTAAEDMWNDVFGDTEKYRHTRNHPGDFPLSNQQIQDLLSKLDAAVADVVRDPTLETVIKLLEEQNVPLVSDVFDIPENDVYTPTASDISIIQGVDEFSVAYNDGEIALLNPHRSSRRRFNTPVRGLVVGFDDTPVGVFGHVIDVTNLDVGETVTRSQIQDAMGFDEEINPYNPRDKLALDAGDRVRMQGDLRLELLGQADDYVEVYSNRVRREEYRSILETRLSGIQIENGFLRGSELTGSDIVDITVDGDGDVVVESRIEDQQATLVALAELQQELTVSPVKEIDNYSDIPYIKQPSMQRFEVNNGDVESCIAQAINDVQDALRTITRSETQQVTEQVQDIVVDVEHALETERQANIPVDNHFVMMQQAYVPDMETEPILAVTDQETTLHIGHGEHNSVTTTIQPGIYEYSVLPRGLQPPDERPTWD